MLPAKAKLSIFRTMLEFDFSLQSSGQSLRRKLIEAGLALRPEPLISHGTDFGPAFWLCRDCRQPA